MVVRARPEAVWEAVRDIGALHTRLVPGFVVDAKLEDGARIVTFGNGIVARERIVTVDDAARRLVWAVVGGRMEHHNGALQVFAADDGCSRVVWIADLLPDSLAESIAGMMDHGMRIMQQTLRRAGGGGP
jgi:hypothetical protein